MISIAVALSAFDNFTRRNRYDTAAIFACDVDQYSERGESSCSVSRGGMLLLKRTGSSWPSDEDLGLAGIRSVDVRGIYWKRLFIPALLVGPFPEVKHTIPTLHTFPLEYRDGKWIAYTGMLVPWIQTQALP